MKLRPYASGSNYLEFLKAAPAGSWGVEVGAGHFQFLDNPTFVQRAVCEEGTAGQAPAPSCHTPPPLCTC